MHNKAIYAKDSVLIIFEPSPRRITTLLSEKMYGSNSIDENMPIRNMCLITCEDCENIRKKANVLEISINEGFNWADIKKHIKEYNRSNNQLWLDDIDVNESYFMDCIYHYVASLCGAINKKKDHLSDKYDEYIEKKKAFYYDGMTATGSSIALLLSFALDLYFEKTQMEIKNSGEKLAIYTSIKNAVNKSFPSDDIEEYIRRQKAKEICAVVNNYFRKYNKLTGELGGTEISTEIKLWHDSSYIYITARNITEILKIMDSNLKFSIETKRTLASMNLIKTYEKADGKPEYTVHLQKQLFGKKAPKERYVEFDREECRKHGIFDAIKEVPITPEEPPQENSENKDENAEMQP